MQPTKQPVKEIFSEQEAADQLGISITMLHSLLDEHIFNSVDQQRPERIDFTTSDLVLLRFWRDLVHNPKIVRMPRRS